MAMLPIGTRVAVMDDNRLNGEVVGHAVVQGYGFNPNLEAMYVVRLDKGDYLTNDTFVSLLVVHPDNIGDYSTFNGE